MNTKPQPQVVYLHTDYDEKILEIFKTYDQEELGQFDEVFGYWLVFDQPFVICKYRFEDEKENRVVRYSVFQAPESYAHWMRSEKELLVASIEYKRPV